MKIARIASILKKEKQVFLYNTADDVQWIGDGNALYPLFDFRALCLDEDSLFAILGIPENQRDKFHYDSLFMPDTISVKDRDPAENQLDSGSMTINTGGRSLLPLRTQKGLVFIDHKYLSPISSVMEVVELYERISPSGEIYIAVKAGFMLTGLIMPVKDAISKSFVNTIKDIADQCAMALEIMEDDLRSQEQPQLHLVGDDDI